MATDDNAVVNDVSKPGTTSADATSKPVIVGHKTLAQDPMLSNQESKKSEDSKPAPTHKTIAPSKDFTAEDTSAPEPEPAVSSSSEEAEVGILAGQVSTRKEKQLAESEEAKKKASIDALVTEKTYFVPIDATKSGRTFKLILWAFLALTALCASFYYAASTGVIPGVEVPPLPL